MNNDNNDSTETIDIGPASQWKAMDEAAERATRRGTTIIHLHSQTVSLDLDEVEIEICAESTNGCGYDTMSFSVQPEQDEAEVDVEVTLYDLCERIADENGDIVLEAIELLIDMSTWCKPERVLEMVRPMCKPEELTPTAEELTPTADAQLVATPDAQPVSTPTTRETVAALLADDDSRVMLLGLLAEAGYSVAKRGGAA